MQSLLRNQLCELFGRLCGIGHCLSEQYYKWINVHPKIASIVYAADRWESSKKIEDWLKKGYVVLSNRYVSANQIHQGGKISNTRKRKAFLQWLNEMEYEVFKIPKPDVVFYLNVPMRVILKLINIPYLENSHKVALWLSKTQKGWIKIECAKNGIIDTRENVHKKIYEKVKKVLI